MTWGEAADAIRKADGVTANALYASDPPLELKPQRGFVPIGMNPKTQLWEFYHLRSAWDSRSGGDAADIEIPSIDDYDVEGRVTVTAETGVVFVLIPGGTFVMGSPDSEAGRRPNERQHQITLRPFFLARHELTQGQWQRLCGDNPSQYAPGLKAPGMDAPVTLAHPVERVDWEMCDRLASDHGLSLPTEAQWEYACRAGTTTPWSSGPESDDLEGYANVLDQRADDYSPWSGEFVSWDDGFVVHGPVGSARPNGFGLLYVHGNVWEWCRDWFGSYSQPVSGPDGLRQLRDSDSGRVNRGGSFHYEARYARSASRGNNAPTFRLSGLGVRLSRPIDP